MVQGQGGPVPRSRKMREAVLPTLYPWGAVAADSEPAGGCCASIVWLQGKVSEADFPN